jgi:hypothetical protein
MEKIRTAFRAERDDYQRGTHLTVAATAASWVACAVGLAILAFARGRHSGWLFLLALVGCVMTMAWARSGSFYSPDDDAACDRRVAAVYAAWASGGLAATAWVLRLSINLFSKRPNQPREGDQQ